MFLEENETIQALRSFPPNEVYFVAPERFVRSGYQYHHQKRLMGYRWNRTASVLAAFVQGTRRYAVLFSVEQGALRFSCDCPAWTAASNCKHVVCALMTTLHLLSNDLFKLPGEQEGHLAPLREALLNVREEASPSGSKRKAVYEIVIGKEKGYPTLSIRKNGSRLLSPWGMPAELARFVSHYNGYVSPFLMEQFEGYLKKEGNRHPILFRTGKGEERVAWSPSTDYRGKTEIEATEKGVTIRAVCFREREEVVPFARFGGLVIDLKEKRLVPLPYVDGWEVFKTLRKRFDRADSVWSADEVFDDEETGVSFEVSHPLFASAQINIADSDREKILGHLLLKIDGEVVSPLPAKHAYAMMIDPKGGGDDRLILRAECRLGESNGLGNKAAASGLRNRAAPGEATTIPLFEFFTVLEQGREISQSLRAQKRKTVLYDLFFKLLPIRTKEEAEKLLRESLAGNDFKKHAIKSEAKEILRYFLSLYLRPEVRLRFYDGRWRIVPVDKSKEALLYRIPYDLFGPEVFRGMAAPNEMSLPPLALHAGLSELYARFKEAGIALFYDKKGVEASRWEFSFDARRASGIDWFEIKPEIRCDGSLIDETVWRKALDRRGVVEKEGVVQILDSNSREILECLAAIYRPGKRGRKEIIRVPRLQILDWIALRRAGVKVALSEADEALIARLTRFERIEETPLPERLAATLRPYQKDGYHWLAFLYRNRFGACLADDMGLGKTLQAISLLAGIREGKIDALAKGTSPGDPHLPGGPHLVVVPPSLLFNWENEVARFYPDLKIHSYTGAARSAAFDGADIVLITYALVRREIEMLRKIPFHVIFFDEAQAVKNIHADTTGAVRRLTGAFKVVMTGTPLENHLGEYYSILDLALPGLLGEYDDFRAETKQEGSPSLDLLLRRTRPFVLRRTKEEILKELPPKTEIDVYLELTVPQKRLYQATVAQIRSAIDDAYRSKTEAQAKIIALTALLKLRQICVSPRLLAPTLEGRFPKIEFLIGRLNELLEAGHSALVFSQFTSFLDLVEEALRREAIPYARLDGSTAVGKRKALVEGFQKGEGASVFLLSLKAGGQGLNLTKASYVFHLDPWWNPAVEDQASDRAHRIGQEKKVSITRILMRHTIEEKMMALKEKKRALYQAVMGETAQAGKGFSISKADFDFLLGS
ncbi:MAG: DEAD/DEAH box helicase [Candidatus Manganitrophus sp. SB1]|nr:DEAD/DEAH box helicase [Candidatus Manganitrophus morganii]